MKRNPLHSYTHTHIHTHAHTHTHTHTHTHHGVVLVWPPARQVMEALCEQCELPVKNSRCNFQSEKGRPVYGWQHVELPDDGRVTRRAKMEERNSYKGVGMGSRVSRLSVRQVCKMVDQCCSCTRHTTRSVTGPSARVCGCRNAGRRCMGCY